MSHVRVRPGLHEDRSRGGREVIPKQLRGGRRGWPREIEHLEGPIRRRLGWGRRGRGRWARRTTRRRGCAWRWRRGGRWEQERRRLEGGGGEPSVRVAEDQGQEDYHDARKGEDRTDKPRDRLLRGGWLATLSELARIPRRLGRRGWHGWLGRLRRRERDRFIGDVVSGGDLVALTSA